MAIVKIWRLEDCIGVGVFTCRETMHVAEILGRGCLDDPWKHPEPREEGIKMTADDFCGFENLIQYDIWFPLVWRRNFAARNIVRLNVYQVYQEYVKYGKFQCVCLARARLIL
jgi:hypothetical protein